MKYPQANVMDLDLDNDDVGVEAWKDMLGIADEREREASGGDEDEGKEDEQEVVEGDDEAAAAGRKPETAATEDSDDLEDGEIRSDSEEEEVNSIRSD